MAERLSIDYGPQDVEERLISEIRHGNGRKDSNIKSVLQPIGKASRVKSLPTKVDNRKYCSPVKDQGQLGSCTANMAANMYEYMCKRGKTSYVELSRLFIYKTTRWLLHLTGDTGAYIRSALGALVVYGALQRNTIHMMYQNLMIHRMYLTPVSLNPFKSPNTLDWTKESPPMNSLLQE